MTVSEDFIDVAYSGRLAPHLNNKSATKPRYIIINTRLTLNLAIYDVLLSKTRRGRQ